MIEKTRTRIEINVICVRIWLVIKTKITPEQSLGSKSQSASAITTPSTSPDSHVMFSGKTQYFVACTKSVIRGLRSGNTEIEYTFNMSGVYFVLRS